MYQALFQALYVPYLTELLQQLSEGDTIIIPTL